MSIKDRFIKVIEDNVPTNDKIVLNSDDIIVTTTDCIPDRFIRKHISISWVEGKENKE